MYNSAVADIPASNDISNEKLMRRSGDCWVRMLESGGREVGLLCGSGRAWVSRCAIIAEWREG